MHQSADIVGSELDKLKHIRDFDKQLSRDQLKAVFNGIHPGKLMYPIMNGRGLNMSTDQYFKSGNYPHI